MGECERGGRYGREIACVCGGACSVAGGGMGGACAVACVATAAADVAWAATLDETLEWPGEE